MVIDKIYMADDIDFDCSALPSINMILSFSDKDIVSLLKPYARLFEDSHVCAVIVTRKRYSHINDWNIVSAWQYQDKVGNTEYILMLNRELSSNLEIVYCPQNFQYADEAAKYFVEKYTVPGDTIFDCDVTSGSSLIAAKELNRHFIGVVQDLAYGNIAARRLEEL